MGLGPLIALGVNYLGEARSRVRRAGRLRINATIDVILIPKIGIVAAAQPARISPICSS